MLTGEEEAWRRKKELPRRNNYKREVATKASHMASLGPISLQSVNFFQKDGNTFEIAKTLAVCEFLQYNLGYTMEDLNKIEILETRMSMSGDEFINVALVSDDDIYKIYIQQSEIRNEDITIRCYIPPNFHKRFMALNSICTDKRKEDPLLKTQLRFGHKDIKVYTKVKGEDSGFRKVELEDFTDVSQLPSFNHSIKWKRYCDRSPRCKTSRSAVLGVRPSIQEQLQRKKPENKDSTKRHGTKP